MHVDAFLNESGFATIQRKAALAERAGFDGVAFPEITGDPLISAAAAALATETITLRTAILVAFPRSPMVVAQAAWQVHEASGGRLVLGLGTQVKGHNERRFSVPWSAPYPRLRDYVWALRAIWQAWQTGERLNFISEHYTHTLMTPEFSPKPSEHGPIAVHAAAVRPAMLRLAGRVADGVRLHGFCTRAYLDQEVLPNLQQGMERVSRPRRAFEVCGGGFIATGPDQEAVAKRLEWIR